MNLASMPLVVPPTPRRPSSGFVLAQDRHRRSAGSALDDGFDAWQAQAGFTSQPKLGEPVRDDAGGPLLSVTQLRGSEDLTPNPFDSVPTRIDGATNGALQIHF